MTRRGVGGAWSSAFRSCAASPTARQSPFQGEFFSLEDALILPSPSPQIPLIVGGRSEAAVGRAARLGDGWLGIWVSARRFAAVRDQISRQAARAGRDPNGFEHALNVWCGFGRTREAARGPLATRMQRFYQTPFDPFERYSPYGTAEDIAAFLSPYVDAGCSAFNVIPCAADDESAIAGVGELRTLLRGSRINANSARAGLAVTA